MKISREEVRHIAHLARLYVSDTEVESLAAELSTIISYIEQLNEVDTTGIEPTTHVLDLVNPTRPDEIKPSLTHEKALGNAPQRQEHTFIVPKVI